MRHPVEADELVSLLARILEGLSVPASIGGPMALGTGYEPWEELRATLRLFGYTTAAEYEEALRGVLLHGPHA
jgi:hypothetical protein